MPARTVQRVEQVPRDQWRALCLECQWVGDETYDETACSRAAYEHNRERHDGAGVEVDLRDFTDLVTDGQRLYRRMYRQCLAMVMVAIIAAVMAARTEDTLLRSFLVGLNLVVGAMNAFLAGKWAARLEATSFKVPLP